MSRFDNRVTGKFLVTQRLGDQSVVNSCPTYEEAVRRAEDLATQSPDNTVWLYKAEEIFTTSRTPVERKKMGK